MYRCATVSTDELDSLRQIERVVRQGRVKHIATDRIVLEDGEVKTDSGAVHVDCSAAGLRVAPARPMFEPERITLQQIRTCQPTFNAALVGFVEAMGIEETEKNRLCPPNPYPDAATDWVWATAISQRAELAWQADPELSGWLDRSRLNAARGIRDRMDDPRLREAVTRYLTCVQPAIDKLEAFRA
jgi:hypothetical protein